MSKIHNVLGRLDFDRRHGVELSDMSRPQKNAAVASNAMNATLQTLNAIPGVAQVSGPVTIGFGVVKLIGAFINMCDLDSEGAGALARSGFKSVGLGAAATALPIAGNVLNGVFAAGDVVDTVNSAM